MLRLMIQVCVATVLLAGLLGCAGDNPPATQSSAEPILVWAAASTKDAVQEIGEHFSLLTGVEVKINPGPSNQLALQIIEGAGADVYLSANRQWAEEVKKAGFAAETCDLLSNRLVLIVPSASAVSVKGAEDLLRSDIRRVALAGENVPAGIYARQSLGKLHVLEALGASNKLVMGHDVRSTLAYVERGEADAGVVYATDAAISKAVKVAAALPEQSHDPVVYPMVLIQRAEIRDAARKFYEYARSDAAGEIFRKYGFELLPR